MRLFAWLVVVILIFYGIYTGAMALQSYRTVSAVVDRVLQGPEATDADKVRGSLIEKTAEAGVPLKDASVLVTEDRALSVRVAWSWPVFEWEGEEWLAIPLSIERTVQRPAERAADQPLVQPEPVVPRVAPPAPAVPPPAGTAPQPAQPSAAPR